MGALLGFAIRFAVNAVLARMIAPEIFGEFALAFVYSELIGILAAAGFGNCVIQFEEGPELTVPATLQLNGIVALTIVVIGTLAGAHAWLVGGASGSLVFVLCLGKAAILLLSTYEAVLQRDLQFARLAQYRVYGVAASMASAGMLAVLKLPYAALLSRELVVGILPALVMLNRVRIPWSDVFRPSSVVREVRRRAFQLGRELFWVQALDTAYQRLDQVLLGWLLGPVELGYYYQAKYVAGLPPAAVMPATQTVALRVFVTLAGDSLRLRRTLELIQVSAAHAMMLAAIVLVLGPHSLVMVAFGEHWGPVADVLPFLAPWVVLQPLAQNTQLALTALSRWRSIRFSRGVQLGTLLIAAPIAVKLWGSLGAALAVAFAIAAALTVLVAGLEPVQRPDPRSYRSILTGLAGAVAVVAVLRDVGVDGSMGEVLRVTAALAAYLISAFLFGGAALREMFGRVARELRPQQPAAQAPGEFKE